MGKIDILYVSAKWCSPCKNLRPKMNKFSDFNIIDIDIDDDENKKIIDTYDIKTIPTLIIKKDNDVLKVYSGSDMNEIEDILNNL